MLSLLWHEDGLDADQQEGDPAPERTSQALSAIQIPKYTWSEREFRMLSTYYSHNSSYINKHRHIVEVQKRGKTQCWKCGRRMTIFPRGKFMCRIVHSGCAKLKDNFKA